MSIDVGIHRWGFAIPRRRLPNKAVQESWNRPRIPGARAIAGNDEDALTLGVQAALQALDGGDRSSVDGLIFASTTAPFAEKSSAVLIGSLLELDANSRFLDVATSLRAGSIALATACDLVASASCRSVLVVAADTRLPRPGSPDEFLFGQAGVALLVGSGEGLTARVVRHCEHASSLIDTWRTRDARFPRAGDQRFARWGAYSVPMQKVLTSILQMSSWEAADVAKVVLYSPDVKSGSRLLAKNGFNLKSQYCDLASPHLGLTGVAHTPLMLAAALESATQSERLIALGYGDGADAFSFQVMVRPERTCFREALARGFEIGYNQYLSLHSLHAGAQKDARGFASEIMEERNKALWLSLKAKRCSACETVITLPLPGCPRCGRTTDLQEFPLQRTGTVYALTHEHYFPTPEPPMGMAVVDLDGGGRLTLQIADENERLQIGDRVELVLRRMHGAGERPNYFWKCRALMNRELRDVR